MQIIDITYGLAYVYIGVDLVWNTILCDFNRALGRI